MCLCDPTIKSPWCGKGDCVNPAAKHEPPPVVNASRPIQDLVMEDIAARKEVGLKKYGTLLQAHNGRDALMDAYQEALDLVMYLRQAIEERDASPVDPDHSQYR